MGTSCAHTSSTSGMLHFMFASPAFASSVHANLRTMVIASLSDSRCSSCMLTAATAPSSPSSTWRLDRVQFSAFCHVSMRPMNLSRQSVVLIDDTSPARAVVEARLLRTLR